MLYAKTGKGRWLGGGYATAEAISSQASHFEPKASRQRPGLLAKFACPPPGLGDVNFAPNPTHNSNNSASPGAVGLLLKHGAENGVTIGRRSAGVMACNGRPS